MRSRIALAAAAMAACAVTAAPTPAHADTSTPPPVPPTPGAWIYGVGHFTYDEPGTYGHRIRFSVIAGVSADGTTHGVLGYRHLLPDGQEAASGHAEVTCVNVHDGTALITAVVPEGQGQVANHAFVLKIIDGGPGAPDRIETLQAQGGPTRPPRYCMDTAGFGLRTYPVEPGGYTFRA
jgi:hypothetical protein